MKITEIIKVKEKKFKPIKIELILESKEEVYIFWHRLNVSWTRVKEGITNNYIPISIDDPVNQSFWNLLDKIVTRIGLDNEK